jgi:CheY-like chemotaxis protein
MSTKIIIVEDAEEIRGIVCDHLAPKMREVEYGAWNNGWESLRENRYDVIPGVHPAFEELVGANDESILWDWYVGRESRILQADVAILDMALTEEETLHLEEAGGTDTSGKTDPTTALQATSGYRLLQMLKKRIPVIATTFANNPRVTTFLLKSGAHAVVTKPLNDADMKLVYQIWKSPRRRGPSILSLTESQLEGARTLGPAVEAYLQTVANEAAKAVKENILRGLMGSTPAYVPHWLISERESFEAEKVDNSDLMLLDVRGFSRLVELGKDKPEGVFGLMNIIWESVIDVLNSHDAEINNFIGDAALIFRGVYGSPRSAAEIRETLTCAEELTNLFQPQSALREKLLVAVDAYYNQTRFIDNGVYSRMVELISSDTFGIRIVVTSPDVDEALYGRVGTDRRWQHTILSRFMNALARTESAIGQWERDRTVQLPASGCHIFLLWPAQKPLPASPKWQFQLPSEFIGKTPKAIRDVPRGLLLYRVQVA